MSLILVLVLVLVVLIIIDLFRKSLRMKQKEALKNIEDKSKEELTSELKENSETNLQLQYEYPLLKDGYLLVYFEGIEPIDVKNLNMFLKYYGIKFTDEKIFQKVNYDDVIFSILPDDDKQQFESQDQGEVGTVIAVMNFKKLAALEYDVKTCYDLLMDVLEALNNSFQGTLMNENRIRLTKKDKQNYLDMVI